MLVAILGGGDWYDASVDHVVVPDGTDIDAKHKEYREWYSSIYVPSLHREDRPLYSKNVETDIKYMSFDEWLIAKCGAREATDEDITVFSEL